MGEIGMTTAEKNIMIITGILAAAIILIVIGIVLDLPAGLGFNLFGNIEELKNESIDSSFEQNILEQPVKEEIKLEEPKKEEIKEEESDELDVPISILINDGDSDTDSKNVNLILKASEVNRCKLWNENEDYYDVNWFDFKTEKMEKDWVLTPSGGEKTVYFQCKNENNQLTPIVFDTINYNKDYPSGSGGGSSRTKILEPADLSLQILSDEREYSTTGVVHILFSVKNAKICELYEEDGFGITVDCDSKSYSDFPLSEGDGIKTIYFKAKNDNKEAVVSKEVILLQSEVSAPVLAMVIGEDNYLTLLINPNSRNISGIIDHYEIYRRSGDAPTLPNQPEENPLFKKIVTTNGNSYKDIQVKEGTTYTYYATAIDIVGRETPRSEYATHTVIGDIPTVELLSPQEGQTTYGMVMAGYTISDDISRILDVDILLNGNKYPVGDKRVSNIMYLTPLQLTYEGEYTLQIRVIDNAGQRGFSEEISFYWYESEGSGNIQHISGSSSTTYPETEKDTGGTIPDVSKPSTDPQIPGVPAPDSQETREQPNNPAPTLS
ncbi:hypothetical protein KO317_01770 [Candidatus Micrarchaeota archaeon]|nr:hypothetical protein [Candidatus Micrarchaeota archaeon]